MLAPIKTEFKRKSSNDVILWIWIKVVSAYIQLSRTSSIMKWIKSNCSQSPCPWSNAQALVTSIMISNTEKGFVSPSSISHASAVRAL